MADTHTPTFAAGDRVRIIAPCSYLSPRLVGTNGTVTRVSSSGVRIETDVLCGASRARYVLHEAAPECLEKAND